MSGEQIGKPVLISVNAGGICALAESDHQVDSWQHESKSVAEAHRLPTPIASCAGVLCRSGDLFQLVDTPLSVSGDAYLMPSS